MRRLALALGLLAALLPAAAQAQSFHPVPPRRPAAGPRPAAPRPSPAPSPPAPLKPALPAVVSSVEFEVGSLALTTIPPPLTLASKPAQLPATDAVGVAVVNPNATMNGNSAPLKNRNTSTSRRIEGTSALPTNITLLKIGQQSTVEEKSQVNCTAGAAATPLRWETFSVRADGDALWTIHDGWFDPDACRITEQRQTMVPARALALLAEQPVAFAARTTDGLVVFFPPAEQFLGDAMTTQVKAVRGPISRVQIPLARGSSTTVVSSHSLPRASAWLSAARGKGLSDSSLGNGALSLRIEVTQTVSEDSPTLLLHLRSAPTR